MKVGVKFRTGGFGYDYIPPRYSEKGRKRGFRNSGTRGRPLTQRHLPTTLQEADDSSCAAKVRIILYFHPIGGR